MPRHQEAKKDATSCEKLWVGANIRQTTDIRMGQPTSKEVSISEYIAYRGEPGELKHLSNPRKRKKTRYPK